MLVWACVCAYAQTDTIRYVHPDGNYLNNGRSWATAKNRVQDAINDLYEYMREYNLTSGSVYIAAGTYLPTESTESSGGSMLNTSFKIFEGIHVYGGFNPTTPEEKPGDRIMANGKKVSENWADQSGIGTTSGKEISSQWDLQHKTILTGNHAGTPVSFTFDSIRGRYNTTYPASSYHVVWFATNGKYTGTSDDLKDHYKPLAHPASLDGCVISSGNASSRSTTVREHTAYGGGVYMVGNSSMRACIVERCYATLRGGGIYCDGGGEIEFCYVHTCQANGVGVVEGYGGGICIDHEGSAGHCQISCCASRCGGGLFISHVSDEYPWDKRVENPVLSPDTVTSNYSPYATACVINNNTANAEGGGVYLSEGGTINHCTVTGNNCSGQDVTYYGRRHGRTGGIYVRNCGMMFNSVFWGNRCDVNNDIQFASVRQKSGASATGFEIFAYHTAFMNHDITDWTGVKKEKVFSLDRNNMPVEGSSANYPCFFAPTVDPNNWQSTTYPGAGVLMHMRPVDYPGPRIWHLTSYSALDQKGVQWNEAVQNASPWLIHAHTDYGVVSNPYEPVSTLGALVRQPDPLTYELVVPQSSEYRKDPSPIPTLFVDPNRKGSFDGDGNFVQKSKEGDSWDVPIKDLGEALSFFRKYLVADEDNRENHHFMIPTLDDDGMPTGEPERYDYVQILVKEGTLTTVGPGNYLNRNIRTAAVRMESHMRMYGGYPSELSGTETAGRNPRDYKTFITANITGQTGELGYQNNSAHVIAMVNAEHAIVDGFTLEDANTHNIDLGVSAGAGGGLLLSNASIAPENRIHMVGNQLRNCVITNCTAPRGAAVFVDGSDILTNNGKDTVCYAELMLVNCVVRNNKADYTDDGIHVNDHGIITANGRAYIHAEHCTVVNNVGYPFKTDEESGYRGYLRIDNSIVFCNADRIVENHTEVGDVANVLSVNPDGQEYVFGKYNMFDADLKLHKSDVHQPHGFFKNEFSIPSISGFLPDGITSHFTTDIAAIPSDSTSRANKAIFTRKDNTESTYPTFVNPSRNVGHSETGDKPLYGGVVAYSPLTTNPCVNAAGRDEYTDYYDYDRSDVTHRDRGGAPDVGAIENTDLPAAGTVIYVTPDGAGKRDGSSWSNAIAGNTVYVLDSVAGPALATGDHLDAEPTCDRVLDNEGYPVLTTDSKYNGGWGRVWFTSKTTGGTATTTVTKTWTTETNVYEDGAREGEVEYLQNNVESETTNTVVVQGETAGGFVAGYDYDPRYPYGEISGASRSFWRANPYHNGTDWNNAAGYTMDGFISACNNGGWINNTRAERYVGGLQYAVEKASARNKSMHKDTVQVWVAAGHYTDYKGFVMRDSVTVLGGFPTGKYPAPGMSERQALMSAVEEIPKSLPTKDFNASQYETILQLSETNPKNTDSTLNTAAVNYWDDDYAYSAHTETTQYEYNTRTIVHHYYYHADDRPGEDVQDTYMKYADMTAGDPAKSVSSTNAHDDNVTDGIHYWRFGESSDGKDCWHMSYPNKTNYVATIENSNNNNNKQRAIYNPDTHARLTGTDASYTGNWIFIGNGSLTDLVLWQDLSGVPEGKYQISVDIAGGYRNKFSCEDDTKMYFRVYDASGTKCAEANIKTRGSYSHTDHANSGAGVNENRGMAYRHVLSFNQPATGKLRIAVEVEDGVRGTGPGGGDPDPIPASYTSNYGANNPNRREFWISNIHIKPIIPGGAYSLDGTDDDTVNNESVPHADPVVEETETYTAQNHRTTLRKRVLTMPDVCVPTYGAGSVGNPAVTNRGKFSDGLSHTHRVFGPTKAKRTSWESKSYVKEDPNYVEYNEANWDGFTIRHGFISEENMAHGGGAGVNLYEGAHLRNCIVIQNISYCGRVKGGGLFCDGATSTIEGCFVLDNLSMHGSLNDATDQNQIFAGGMFMYEGTCFNSLFANNYSYGSAGGLGFCVGRFFNNTIAYNTCNLIENGQYSGGAISLAISSTPNLFVANTVIYGNNGIAIRDRNTAVGNVNPFLFCYIQSEKPQPYDATNKNVTNWKSTDTNNYGTENIYLNGVAPSAVNTPFAADFVNGVYTPGNASATNDFRLLNHAKTDSSCVNHGTEEFASEFYTALRHKGKTDSQIRNSFIYQNVEQAEIPQNDVAFAKRVQDCQIDIGAYEYNAAYGIIPDTTTHPGIAIFYTTYVAPGGDASARSPENAACLQKLQLVLDAAGRYKHNLMTLDRYSTVRTPAVSQKPDKSWAVEVWLEGDSVGSRTTNTYVEKYTPTRSTRHSDDTYQDNTLDYSFIVPHGVHLKGGFKANFYHYEDEQVVDDRDPLTFRTVLSGYITSSTGATGQCYHVVTFTNDLFSPDDEKLYKDNEGNLIKNQLAILTEEKDRAVLDGLFLMDGKANAPDEEGKNGGACIVTDYAHVRNCVIQNNTADGYGGGLYLKPLGLVSGTIVKNNTADIGGGIYVEAPSDELSDEQKNASVAHVFSSTICENTGRSSAGGLFFDNTYARINSSAIWHNNANDNANVAGNFARSADTIPYPMNCCAVESRRLEGQGNIELSPKETEGVRWDRLDPFNAVLYYPIEMSSTLARAGISYTEWDNFRTTFATLDSMDIAGVSRKRWYSDGSERGYAWTTDTLVTKNNDVIDIGARAINKNFEVHVDAKYVMHRLFVMHTDLIDSKAARALQDNTNTDSISNMYRQMGSCIYNPFHRLDDAFSYIIKARMMDSTRYRNTRFEVFVEQGTYYPLRDAYLRQGAVRMNTFLVPEAILIVGGVDSRPADHKYGQAGFKSPFSTVHHIGNGLDVPIPGTEYTIKYELTDSIRLRDARHRPMRDNNLNSVIEPWELERQTILSGNAVAGEDFTHVYHVVTCHADNRYVGPRPNKFGARNPDYNPLDPNTPSILTDSLPTDQPARWVEENDLSILARTIGFDGLQITGGYANHVDSADTEDVFVTKSYFRGGGIYVDGNWWEGAGNDPPDMTQPAQNNIPIVVENCVFTNNMAGNGGAIYSNGAIYAYGNHFTQNYSQGPMTKLDQKYIPWTAGGCIATNAVCDVSNTLFANNEARRGLYPLTAESDEPIPNADARQGFGGCLSIADKSLTRVVNCHFVKNKAVAYSAMYNFYPNDRYSNPDSMQYAFNTIFWGNEVFEVNSLADLEKADDWTDEDNEVFAASCTAFEDNYKKSRAGVFHYDGDEWDRYEELFHRYDSTYNYWVARNDTFNKAVVDTLMKLRAQGNKIEGLYFCSYRKTYGPTGMKPTSEGYLLTKAERDAWVDPRARDVRWKMDANDDKVEDYRNLWTHVSGNNNTLINMLNTATDGPNFKQPSFVAGIDGYMQNADWLLARMNQTTDQGWGHLKQEVTRGIAYYITKYTGDTPFKTAEEALAAAKEVEPSATEKDVYPVKGLPVAAFLGKDDQPDPGAMYNFLSWRYGRMMSESNAPLPLRYQYYMSYTHSFSDTEMSGNMDRISKNPKMDIEDVYIDLGIYEYQYVQLDIKGQEIDTVWVATKAKDPLKQDGLSWETPTTDMQTAIDLLMSSHNNHDKYVCLLGDDEGGTFSPQNVIDNRRAFVISSNSHAPLLPDSAVADYDYGVSSLTFLGGYSFDVPGAPRDPYANPTVIEMPNIGNKNQLNQLFVVEDMTRQMLQINYQGEYISRDSVVIPIVFDGITFINPYSVKERAETGYSNLGGSMSKKGGAAIYYRWQRQYEGDGTSSGSFTPNINLALHPDSALIDGRKVTLPKLTISNCIFMDNGDRSVVKEERSPAVRIDHGGGSSLIVNTLFHSNAGAPVYARTFDILEEENDLALVPNDVCIINCTSALNDGHIRLESENSEVHNSLIWLDDLNNDTTVQLQLGASDVWDKTTNKNRTGIAGRMTKNAVWGCFQLPAWGAENSEGDSVGFNHPLSTDNNDIYKGPGFFSPYVTATTSEERRERSFRLNPTIRTVGMANSELYWDRVFFRQYPNLDEGEPYWRRSNGFKDATVTSVAEDVDLAGKSRFAGGSMERGAYECLVVLQRVLYVRPQLHPELAGDGTNWDKAFGQGQLQNAIDAASVYTYMNQSAPREDRIAYVFVKGSGNTSDFYNLKARDGVYVFGSLPGYFNDTAWIDTEQKKFTNEECHRFVNYVRAYTSGVASPSNTQQTRINSIHITGDEFKTGFLLDGFVITSPDIHTNVLPVWLDNEKSAVRNCLIVDNAIREHPVAEVDKGLLYNCLFYNDSAHTVVKVGANGLVLNNTIISEHEDVTPLDDSGAAVGAVQNTIALNTTESDLTGFAPYMTARAPYTLPAYLTEDKQLSFQLHESSAYLNTGTTDDALPALFNGYKTDGIICFKWDRDVLGNPRTISSAVDKGALETWFVAANNAQEITAITNRVVYTSTSTLERDTAYTKNFGGHKYPHPGSVVYLMDSSAMSMQYTSTDFEDFRGQTIYLTPGYMLLKPGASFYGNGHKVQLGYLAAEKHFVNQQYSMTAMPFDYDTANITPKLPFATYQYSGADRSAKDYVFQTDNSSLWKRVDITGRTATDGYLMDFGAQVDTVLRFTAFAPSEGQFVYTEGEDKDEDGYPDDKYIYLTQYDNRTAGTGSELNFTRQEDMGWNMKGLPWLVSDYRTDTIVWEDNYLRQMHIPHVLYQMDGAGDYLQARDQIYTSRSWDRGATVSMGAAFLTQTATTQTREKVTFRQPYYGLNDKVGRPLLRLAALTGQQNDEPSSFTGDVITVLTDSTASKTIQYTYGRDGLKWMANDSVPQIYMLDSKGMSRLSLLGAAPTQTEIPLGVKIPADGQYSFSLPEKEAFEAYPYIWLVDHAQNRYTNLLTEDYELTLEKGDYHNRFALRIGGYPKTDEKGRREYTVFTHDGVLFVRGLVEGDKIAVYSPAGQVFYRATTSASEWSMPLPYQSGYIVKVNDRPHKVLNL